MASPLSSPHETPDPDFADLLAQRPHLRAHVLDGLVMDDVPLVNIAREAGTPCWVYSAATLRRRHAALRDALRGALERVMASGEYADVLSRHGVREGLIAQPSINGGAQG